MDVATSFTIRAAFNGASRSTTIMLKPVAINTVSANPASITGSLAATGAVTLNGPAPAAASSWPWHPANTSALRVPATVTVLGGATSATFAITTSYVDSTTNVMLSGSFDGLAKSAAVKVVPVTVGGVTLQPPTVVGGQTVSVGTVKLTAVAPPGGVDVTLASSDPVVSVQTAISISAGQSSGTFTALSSTVTASIVSVISATDGRTTRTAKLTVNPLGIASLSISGTQYSGLRATAVIVLNGVAPVGGARILLSMSDATKATAPTPC